ncbi:MAG: hypothetical protein QM758_30125 [Armatimonas sp.]
MKFETNAQREFNALCAAIFLCGFPGIVVGLTEGWMLYPLLFLPFIFLIIALIAGHHAWLWLVKGAGIFGAGVALGVLFTVILTQSVWEIVVMCSVSLLYAFCVASLLGLPGTLIISLISLRKQS